MMVEVVTQTNLFKIVQVGDNPPIIKMETGRLGR
jgi:hypothetical protein